MKKTLAILLVLSSIVFASNSRYLRPQVNTVGLIAHYKLWDGPLTATTVFDYSLNGYTGALKGSNYVFMYPGLYLAGSDYIDTEETFQSTFQSSFSISMWVKPDDGQPASSEYFGGLDEVANNKALLIHSSNGAPLFQYQSNGNAASWTSSSALFANGQETWHHLVFVADSTIAGVGGLKIYFDGVMPTAHAVFKGDTSSVVFADYALAIDLYIGTENVADGTPGNCLTGLVDDVMVFNVAKTAAEVKSIYEVTKWRYQK